MDSMMALKDHSVFNYVHGGRFPRQSKVFVFKTSMDLPRSSMDLVKNMQVGGDIKKS